MGSLAVKSQIRISVAVSALLVFGGMTRRGMAQNNIQGKYIDNGYPSTYLILRSDSTFKYSYQNHLMWDIGCGTYKLKADVLILSYTADYYDTADCNIEMKGYLKDETGDWTIFTNLVDREYRPDTLVVRGRKLHRGTSQSSYYFIRQKIKHK